MLDIYIPLVDFLGTKHYSACVILSAEYYFCFTDIVKCRNPFSFDEKSKYVMAKFGSKEITCNDIYNMSYGTSISDDVSTSLTLLKIITKIPKKVKHKY